MFANVARAAILRAFVRMRRTWNSRMRFERYDILKMELFWLTRHRRERVIYCCIVIVFRNENL